MMRYEDQVRSTIDNTIKYIFSNEHSDILEVSYINKNDGKDIICVPTQTACNMGCKFCHLTGLNKPAKNLSPDNIFDVVCDVVDDVAKINKRNNTLLISYMGAGEPLLNIDGVMRSAMMIYDKFHAEYEVVRFAVASIIPKKQLMERFMDEVKDVGLDFKFHLSLHTVETEVRRSLMPHALESLSAINMLTHYANNIGRAEVHYTLMDHVNDSVENVNKLVKSIKGTGIAVKLLQYSDNQNMPRLKASRRMEWFHNELKKNNIESEIYDPPGRDVGSSCGQFDVSRYGVAKKLEGLRDGE